MFPHLTSGRVNLALLQEAGSKEFLNLLEKCEGTKTIVWDDSLIGPVGLMAKYAVLKERNVVKMMPLRAGKLPDVDVKNVVFITRPNLKLMDYIADNVLNEEKKKLKRKKEFHLFFLPSRSLVCEKHLKMKGVYGSFVNVCDFNCDFFPVDYDLLSLELKDVYRDLYIDGDPTCLYYAANGLVTLQKQYGRIPKIYGKGNFAQKVWELTKTIALEDPSLSDKGAIDQLVILDRSIDLMSVLATQLTYEGLIDEIFGINQTTVNFPSDTFSKSDDSHQAITSGETQTIILTSGEELYAEIRDKNFNGVGQILTRHAKSISSQLEQRHGDKSVQDMKRFVERLPHLLVSKKSLATHTTIAEKVKEVTDSYDFSDELSCEQDFIMCTDVDRPSAIIEEMIAKKAPLRTVLRLMCMQCVAGSGFKPKVLDFYKRELVQVYGIGTLLTLGHLERAGLLKVQTGSRTYAVLRKTLNLTVDDALEVAPKDISYVHSFYAPLSCRIIENILKPLGWQALNDVISNLPGPAFEDFQSPMSSWGGRRGSLNSEQSSSDVPRVILVFFLGGCTYAEIAALRFLAQQEENNVEFVIATTKLINKNTFLDEFIETFEGSTTEIN